jgi:hypothetical protein
VPVVLDREVLADLAIGETFSNELGLLYVALLPRGTPANDLTEHPAPATGPWLSPRLNPCGAATARSVRIACAWKAPSSARSSSLSSV